MERLVQTVVDALSVGSLYALTALGIGLIFGVMRLINFAHGELITMAAYTLLALFGLPIPVMLFGALAVAIILALVTERAAFRPLRRADPTTLLISSFAVSFFLQKLLILVVGSRLKGLDFLPVLGHQIEFAGIRLQMLQIATIIVSVVLLVALTWFLKGTRLGLHMRAAAEDFRMARVLGVRANSVIAMAFALSGVLAAAVSCLVVVQTGVVQPRMGVQLVIIAFVGTVIGGLGSLPGAALGGFLVGAASILLQALLPPDLRAFREAFVFAAVALVLLFRPQGLIAGPRPEREDLMSDGARFEWPHRRHAAAALAARRSDRDDRCHRVRRILRSRRAAAPGDPGLDRSDRSCRTLCVRRKFPEYLSFGNVAFMAVGAYVSALLTMKPAAKSVFLPDLPALIASAEWSSLPGALAGGVAAAIVALVVGWPLMRLTGVSASIATFAILVVANVVFGNWTAVTGGQNSLMGLPAYVDLWTALGWAIATIVIAFVYQETRSALLLRASREDEAAAQASGVNVVLHRLIAFVISGFLSGISGVLLAHFLGIVRVENFYLDLTFLIVAMLIIGGRGSLTGAVAGAVVIAALTELLRQSEIGVQVGTTNIAAPAGIGDVVLALIMLLIILFRPDGIAAGRELTWPFGR